MRFPILALLLILAGPLAAQPGPPARGPGGPAGAMATRSVSAYLQLERDLEDAMGSGRLEPAKRFLAPDFEERAADQADAIALDDWLLQETRNGPRAAGVVRELAVREFDGIDVVSFVLDREEKQRGRGKGRAGKSKLVSWSVVDVWQRSTKLLLVRYLSRSAATLPAPARPSGRE